MSFSGVPLTRGPQSCSGILEDNRESRDSHFPALIRESIHFAQEKLHPVTPVMGW